MENENELAPNGNGGDQQLMPNQHPVQATNAAKQVSEIDGLIKNAQESAGGETDASGFVHSALNYLLEAVSHIAAKLLCGFAVVCSSSSTITGAVAHNPDGHPDGSCEVKTFAATDLKVAVGTFLAIVGGILIAARWMYSRRPTFTEADIMDGLAMGPAVARRSDPTFEIHPTNDQVFESLLRSAGWEHRFADMFLLLESVQGL